MYHMQLLVEELYLHIIKGVFSSFTASEMAFAKQPRRFIFCSAGNWGAVLHWGLSPLLCVCEANISLPSVATKSGCPNTVPPYSLRQPM